MLPTAKSAPNSDERRKLRRIVEERGLVGLANDTKWDELLTVMRSRQGWRPSYRYQCIDGPPSEWDAEWDYHLPFPLLSVEWMDLSRREEVPRGRLLSPLLTDHVDWIEAVLDRIGFEYETGEKAVRIFAYAPKNMALFSE